MVAIPRRLAVVVAGALFIGFSPLGAAADDLSGRALGCADVAGAYTGPGQAVSRCHGAPSLSIVGPGGGFKIDNEGGSGGIILDIDYACVACVLVVEGEQLGGDTPTLRVSVDGWPPKWMPLRHDKALVDLPPFRKLEIYVYQDENFEFTLHNVGLFPFLARYRPDTDPHAARLFLERMLGWQIRPAAFRPTVEQAVNVMRKLVPQSDMGLYDGGIETGPVFDRGSFLDMHEYFMRKRGGMICGGHAAYLTSALNALGFDAATFNFGVRGNNLTHVVVVLHDGGRFHVLDPTFNMVFKRGDCGVMTIDELMPAPMDRIIVDEIPDSGRLFFIERELKDFKNLCKQELYAKGDDVAVCLNDSYDIDYYFLSPGGLGDELAGTGDTALERYMNLLRAGYFNIPHFASEEARNAFRALMETHGVPAHPQS